MKVVSVNQMRTIEGEANENGLSFNQMMQNAGRSLAEIILREYSQVKRKTLLGLIGTGNNGGDTLIAMTLLLKAGWDCKAYLLRQRSSEDGAFQDYLENGGMWEIAGEDESQTTLVSWMTDATIILDGILGTGLRLPVHESIASVLKTVGSLVDGKTVIAVDCPSGVNCDSGEVADECLVADVTVTLGAVKRGLLCFPACKYSKKIIMGDIGLNAESKTFNQSNDQVITARKVLQHIPKRPLDAHKGTFGSALIVAGSINYCGAATLAGEAAYRIGAGLVQMAIPSILHTPLASRLPEVTWLLLPHEDGVIADSAAEILARNIEKTSAMLLGPGWGTEKTTQNFLKRLLNWRSAPNSRMPIGFISKTQNEGNDETFRLPPLVIDADGLKCLAKLPDGFALLPPYSILTPHPGEMSILTGISTTDIQANRQEIARQYAKEWQQIVVLKGAITVVANPEGDICLIPFANPALARAGTGDVLAGMICSLLAQGMAPYEAAFSAAWIHGKAGENAVSQVGHTASVIASDLIKAIPQSLCDLSTTAEEDLVFSFQ